MAILRNWRWFSTHRSADKQSHRAESADAPAAGQPDATVLERLEERVMLSADLPVLLTDPLDPWALAPLVDNAPAVAGASELVFINGPVPDNPAVIDALQQLSQSPTLQLHVLSDSHSGLQQIEAVLARQTAVSTIHIIADDAGDGLQLGNTLLAHDNLQQHQDALARWRAHLTPDARLLVYDDDHSSARLDLANGLATLTASEVFLNTAAPPADSADQQSFIAKDEWLDELAPFEAPGAASDAPRAALPLNDAGGASYRAVDVDLGNLLSGTSLSITPTQLTGNDTGTEGQTPSLLSVSVPGTGNLVADGGNLRYSSVAGASGAVSFEYRAMTGHPDLISQWRLAVDGSDDAGLRSGTVNSDASSASLVFDGNDYVEIPVFSYPDDFTLSFNFKVNDLGNDNEEVLFAQGDYRTPDSLLVWITGSDFSPGASAGKLVTDIWGSGDSGAGFDGYEHDISAFENDGLWHNYTIVVRQGAGVSIYIDGVQRDSGGAPHAADGFSPTENVFIGVEHHSENGLDDYLKNHQIADLRLSTGFDLAAIQANQLNEFSGATVSLSLRNEELLVNNERLLVSEDNRVAIRSTDLRTTDIEDPASAISYQIVSSANYGTLLRNGTALDSGDSFTQQQIDNNQLQYRHNGDESATHDTVALLVDDGLGSATSLSLDVDINLTNDAPVLTLIESAALDYSEGDGAVNLFDSVVLSDADDTNIVSASVLISENYRASQDRLVFVDSATISAVYDSAQGMLTMSGSASKTDWQSALRSIRYLNSSDDPDPAPRTVTVSVNDGQVDSLPRTRGIVLTAVNDPPVISDTRLAAIDENSQSPAGASVAQLFSGRFSDPDGSLAGIAVIDNAGGAQGSWQYAHDGSASWLAIDAVSADSALLIDADTRLRFLPATDYYGPVPSLTVVAIDDSWAGSFSNAAARVDGDTTDDDFAAARSELSATIGSSVNPLGPTDLSSGISLNNDGGNNAYLLADNGGDLLRDLDALTVEAQFSIDQHQQLIPLLSYAATTSSNTLLVAIRDSGVIAVWINGYSVESAPRPELLDGQRHAVAISWDSVNGDYRLYADGELALAGSGLAVGDRIESGGTLLLGQVQDSAGGNFDVDQVLHGTYYDLRIWDEPRQGLEIARDHHVKLHSQSAPDSLIANWQMDTIDNNGVIADVVSEQNMTVRHVNGEGFVNSNPIASLRVPESALDNTVIGLVVATRSTVGNDLLQDGSFTLTGSDATTIYQAGDTIGGSRGHWQVDTGSIDVAGAWPDTPAGGKPLDLDGNGPGSISQQLSTEIGQTYQLNFLLSGNFGDPTVKRLQLTAGTEVADFSVSPTPGWSDSQPYWQPHSMTFTATANTTEISFASLSSSGSHGPVIADVQLAELSSAVAELLASDATLHYDGGTGKFYQAVGNAMSWHDARAAASENRLNGVAGQLVTIRSQYEQNVVREIGRVLNKVVWLGASDQTSEGQWRWQSGSSDDDPFWQGAGTGSAVNGAFENWNSGEPNNSGTTEDVAVMRRADGLWNDLSASRSRASIVEWDASDVLNKLHFELRADPSGVFAVDSDSGEIRVANNAALDYEADVSHDITVRVGDVDGHYYDEVMTIWVGDSIAPQLAGIETRALAVLENAALTAVSHTLTVNDVDTIHLRAATVQIAGGYVAGQDRLVFVDTGSLGGNWDAASGTLTITGVDTLANWQAALRSVGYLNSSDDPAGGDRRLEFIVNDGVEDSNTLSRTISLSPVNDAPLLGNATLPAIAEDTIDPAGATIDALFGGQFTDPDGDFTGIAVGADASTAEGRWQYSSNAGGDWHAVGSVHEAGALLLSSSTLLRFVPAADFNGQVPALTVYALDDTITAAMTDGALRSIADVTDRGAATPYSARAATLTSQVSAVFDPPYNGGTLPTVVSTAEDVPLAIDLSALQLNSGDHTEALTLQLASDLGAALSASADPAVSLSTTGGALQISAGVAALNDYLDTNPIIFQQAEAHRHGDPLDRINLELRYATTSVSLGQIAVDVSSVNDAPSVADSTLLISEDSSHTFSIADFSFADPNDGDDPLAVQIVSAADRGELSLNGTPVVDGQSLAISDIGAGLLRFSPAADASGSGYTAITYRMQDDGGVANGGDDLSDSTATITIDVSGTRDAPELIANDVSVLRADTLQLGNSALQASDADVAPELRVIVLDSRPQYGVLQLSGAPLAVNDRFSYADVLAGALSYSHDGIGSLAEQLDFSVLDAGPAASGSSSATLIISVTETHPLANNDSATVDEGQAVLIDVLDNDSAADQPLQVASVQIDTAPLDGTATVLPSGDIRYLHSGAEGNTDTFSYTVADSGGDVSTAATVAVTINAINDPPQLVNFAGPALQGAEDTVLAINSTTLASMIDHSDAEDGALSHFRVTEVLAGTLLIGDDAATATPFAIGSNDRIATTPGSALNGYWLPEENVSGAVQAFAVRGIDSDNAESAASVIVPIEVAPVNDAPRLSGYDTPLLSGTEDSPLSITLAELQAASSDVEDTSVAAMQVTTLDRGILLIGPDLRSARPFEAGVTDTIDAVNNAYWTPPPDANGTLPVFSLRAVDSAGQHSPSEATVQATLSAVNDAPLLAGYENAIINTSEDSTVLLTVADLQANSSDIEDGQLAALRIERVVSGELLIGASLATASPFMAGTNDTLDDANHAFWTPALNTFGNAGALLIRGIDQNAALSDNSATVFATVTAVNDAPLLAGYQNAIASSLEDNTLVLALDQLQAASSDVEDGTLQGVVVQSVVSGTLRIGPTETQASHFISGVNDTIDAGNQAFWTPAANANGTLGAFTIKGIDSAGLTSADSALVSATVDALNDAPELSPRPAPHAVVAEDQTLTLDLLALSAATGASDIDGSIDAIRIESLLSGSLSIGSDAASASAFVVADNDTVDATTRAYWTPDLNAHNNAVPAFAVRALDDNGADSAAAQTISIDVFSVNDPPRANGVTLSVTANATTTLTVQDFGFSDPVEGHDLLAIQIEQLPGSGQLLASGTPVQAGQQIGVDIIDSGQLRYTPVRGEVGVPSVDQIGYRVRDTGGDRNGGMDTAVTPALLQLQVITLDELVTAPPAPEQAFNVVENLAAGTVVGRLDAIGVDPVFSHLEDGDFNNAARPFSDINRYSADGRGLGATIGAWQVLDGNVDLRGSFWASGPAGGAVLDLNGNQPGTITQQIETTPGASYSVSFAMSGNFRGASMLDVVRLEVTSGSEVTQFEFAEPANWSEQDPQWQQQTLRFTATDTLSTIAFRALDGGSYGPLISDLEVLDELHYSTVAANPAFTVNEDGVVLLSADTLDHETQSLHVLEYQVSDVGGDSVAGAITINVLDINESPELQANTLLRATVLSSVTLDENHLRGSDQDRADQLPDAIEYLISNDVRSGFLMRDDTVISIGDSFTQADVMQQRISYTHTGTEAEVDSFRFLLRDGGEDGATGIEREFNIAIFEPLELVNASRWPIHEGQTLQLDSSHLTTFGGYTGSSGLLIEVVEPARSVQLFDSLSGNDISSFTMQALDAGSIHLRHNGDEPHADSLALALYRLDGDSPILVDESEIELQILDVADSPRGVDSHMATDHLTALVITAEQLGFDDAQDGDELHSIVIESLPASGTVLLAGNPLLAGSVVDAAQLQAGELRYQPYPLVSGVLVDVIEFRIIDSGDADIRGANTSSDSYRIEITVTSDHSPVAVTDRIEVIEGGSVSSLNSGEIKLTHNDIDLDTPTEQLLVRMIGAPLHGVVELNADGSFIYRHDGSETRSDSFSYRVVDDAAELSDELASIGLVEIEILPGNDEPQAGVVADRETVAGQPLTLSLPEDLFSDIDADDELTLSATLADGSALPAWLEFDSDSGTFSGTPDFADFGQLELRVTATDIAGAEASSTFELLIEPHLDAALATEPDSTPIQSAASDNRESIAVAQEPETGAPDSAPTASAAQPAAASPNQDISDETPDLFSQLSDTKRDLAQQTFEDKIVQFQRKTDAFEKTDAAAIADPTAAIELQQLFFASGDFSLDSVGSMLKQLARNRDDLMTVVTEQQQMVVGSSVAVSTGLSLGYVVWLVRGGLLVGSMMSAMPAWRWIDPVPVLGQLDDGSDSDSESLQTIVDDEPETTDRKPDESDQR